MNKGSRDGQTLAHASRKLTDEAIFDAAETDAAQQFTGTRVRIRHLIHPGEEAELLHGAQRGIDRDPRADDAEGFAGRGVTRTAAADLHISLGRAREAAENAQES